MLVLAIETSCDETAVCLIEASGDFGGQFKFDILGNALYSQAKLHEQYGGVFPNLAKREHAKNLVPLLKETLRLSEIPGQQGGSLLHVEELGPLLSREPELFEHLSEFLKTHGKPVIDCIAVTYGPGLEPCLWVGVNFAKALSLVWDIPIVAVNHMEGHVVMSLMEENRISTFEFPLLALLISGGHTELVVSKEFQRYEVVGQTRDDAAGEAFDKVARLLGLPYPGGPEISKLAAELREQGDSLLGKEAPWKLPRPMLHEDNLDFSFAGLKTAVRKIVDSNAPLSDEARKHLAMEFENATAEVLIGKTMRAIDQFGANTIVVGGGVSANTYIREQLAKALEAEGNPAKLLIPPPELATDNALMIALAGYFHATKKEFAEAKKLAANGNLKLC
jgi:N6-L-threonylcarbamoyladenine synthase